MDAANPGAQPYKTRTAAVIPAFNEERFIASVVITARSYADVVVVADDGSTDRTATLAEQAGAHVVRLPRNAGKGAALNAGFEYVRQFAPDVVVMLDADAQHDPAEIPAVAKPVLEHGADVVIGSRFLGVKSRIPLWRRFGQHALNAATNAASGVQITDTQSGYRAFSPAALQMLRFRSKGLAVESEMQFLLQNSDLRVEEVPISVQYRDGNKRNPVAHGLKVLDAILSLAARRRPLLFFALPGAVLTLVSFLLGFYVLDRVGQHQGLPIGTLIVGMFLGVAGLVLGVTGVTLNTFEKYIRQIHEEISRLSPAVNEVDTR
ncbi:MAG: glycosyltransferase family 2 protein [Bacilli bacterium]